MTSTTEPDPNSYLAENVNLPDMTGSTGLDSDFLVSNDDTCDVQYVNYPQLLGKVRRRGASCKTPTTGEDQGSNEPTEQSLFDSNEISDFRIFRMYPKIPDLCPARIFGASNTPVCKDISSGEYLQIVGVLPITLLDVNARLSISCLWSWHQG